MIILNFIKESVPQLDCTEEMIALTPNFAVLFWKHNNCSMFQCGSNTQLLHVFQEDFILGYKPHKEDVEGKETEIFFQPSQGIA